MNDSCNDTNCQNYKDCHSDNPDITKGCAPNPKKYYYWQMNIGKIKYLVNYYDGVKTHRDGSPFYDIKTFTNKKKMESFLKDLSIKGYKEK